MSMEYIRRTYNVPARRGCRIMTKYHGKYVKGVITGSTNASWLRVRLDGERKSRTFHPDGVAYLGRYSEG